MVFPGFWADFCGPIFGRCPQIGPRDRPIFCVFFARWAGWAAWAGVFHMHQGPGAEMQYIASLPLDHLADQNPPPSLTCACKQSRFLEPPVECVTVNRKRLVLGSGEGLGFDVGGVGVKVQVPPVHPANPLPLGLAVSGRRVGTFVLPPAPCPGALLGLATVQPCDVSPPR